MTVMLWRLDADDIAGALEIARYALTWGLTMPVGATVAPRRICWPKKLRFLRSACAMRISHLSWRCCSIPSTD